MKVGYEANPTSVVNGADLATFFTGSLAAALGGNIARVGHRTTAHIAKPVFLAFVDAPHVLTRLCFVQGVASGFCIPRRTDSGPYANDVAIATA